MSKHWMPLKYIGEMNHTYYTRGKIGRAN
jgi:hypothetical protein